MTARVDDLVFRARALAQAHPLTPVARTYVDRVVGDQRRLQPLEDIAMWVQVALVSGYCLRLVEEGDAGAEAGAVRAASTSDIDDALETIVVALRSGNALPYLLGPADEVFLALNQIVQGEIERRLDQWRDSILDDAADEIEEYITWWVVNGYALRAAETSVGTPSCAS